MVNNILLYLVLLIPPALVSGPFLPDLFVSLSGLLFLFICFQNKLWNYFINKASLIFLIFYVYLVARSFFAAYPIISLESSLFYFRYIFFCYAIIYLIENVKNFYKFFFISIANTLLIVVFDSSIQFFTGMNLLGYTIPSQYHYISGFFGEEKILGSFFVRLLPIFLFFYFIIFKDNILNNVILIFIFFTSLFVAVISGERSSVLLVILFYVCLVTSLSRMILFRLSIVFFSISIFSLILFFTIKIIENPNYLQVTDNNSPYKKYEKLLTRNIKQTVNQLGLRENKNYYFSKVHQSHYDSALKMFNDNMFFGQAPKMFRVLCKEQKYHSIYGTNQYNKLVHCSTHPHNTYIQLLAETGIIGFSFPFLFFLFISFQLFRNLYFKIIKGVKTFSNSTICLMSCIFMNLWPLVPTGNFFNNWLSIFYFLPIAFYLSKYFKQYNNS